MFKIRCDKKSLVKFKFKIIFIDILYIIDNLEPCMHKIIILHSFNSSNTINKIQRLNRPMSYHLFHFYKYIIIHTIISILI